MQGGQRGLKEHLSSVSYYKSCLLGPSYPLTPPLPPPFLSALLGELGCFCQQFWASTCRRGVLCDSLCSSGKRYSLLSAVAWPFSTRCGALTLDSW